MILFAENKVEARVQNILRERIPVAQGVTRCFTPTDWRTNTTPRPVYIFQILTDKTEPRSHHLTSTPIITSELCSQRHRTRLQRYPLIDVNIRRRLVPGDSPSDQVRIKECTYLHDDPFGAPAHGPGEDVVVLEVSRMECQQRFSERSP